MKVDQSFEHSLRGLEHVFMTYQQFNKPNNSSRPAERLRIGMAKARLCNMDREVKRVIQGMESLGFLHLTAKSHNGNLYFVAMTDNIYVIVPQTRGTFFNMGNYIIGIPERAFCHTDLQSIHMVPLKRMDTNYRHFHHIAVHPDDHPANSYIHPFSKDPRTCWGTIGAMMLDALADVDLLAAFNTCKVFLESVAYNDSLTADPSTIATVTREEYVDHKKKNDPNIEDRIAEIFEQYRREEEAQEDDDEEEDW